MDSHMSKGGQEVPDYGPRGPGVSIGSQKNKKRGDSLFSFIDWSPLRNTNASKYVKNGQELHSGSWRTGVS